MTTRAEQLTTRYLVDLERRQFRRAALERNGASTSDFGDAMAEAEQRLFPREDNIAVEAVNTTITFLRALFVQPSPGRPLWVGTGEGMTDVVKSDIIIESNLVPKMHRDDDPNKPALEVQAGPRTFPVSVLGGTKHYDLRTDALTHTDLTPGTVQILIRAQSGAEVSALADHVALNLRALWPWICHQRWHSLGDIAVSAFDADNPIINRGSIGDRSALAVVTFTYYHQWTVRSERRPGTRTLVELLYGALTVQDVHSSPDRVAAVGDPSDPGMFFAVEDPSWPFEEES